MVVVQSQADLFDVVEALGACGGLSKASPAAGKSRPIKIAMMAITTNSSIKVNAALRENLKEDMKALSERRQG